MQSLTFIALVVSEKMPILKFQQAHNMTDQKHVCYFLWMYTSFTQIIIAHNLLMYVATVQCQNYSTVIQKAQFAVYISKTSVTLKQRKGHQTHIEIVDPEQGYNPTKFEKTRFNSIWQKGNIKGVFF